MEQLTKMQNELVKLTKRNMEIVSALQSEKQEKSRLLEQVAQLQEKLSERKEREDGHLQCAQAGQQLTSKEKELSELEQLMGYLAHRKSRPRRL